MPFEIEFDNLPAGYALSNGRHGETVRVVQTEFCSSEDGDYFIRRLEGFPSTILNMLPPESRIKPSSVDHLLAVIHQDRKATIYVNELSFLIQARSKRNVELGDPVLKHDIADIQAIHFDNVDIPKDTGVIFLFSVGWRKGLFFDVTNIQKQNVGSRAYDLDALLGQYYAYLLFQEFFKIPESGWARLFSEGWFPFISLHPETVQELVNYSKTDWCLDELLGKISSEVRQALPSWIEKWERGKYFTDHIDILKVAVDRLLASDYVSAVAILYPRIEGVMRSYHVTVSSTLPKTQSGLIQTSLSSSKANSHSKILLLPEKFRTYLNDIYFANFDPTNPKGLSRNTVAHGVAIAIDFSEKSAIIGFLILDQLSFYMATESDDTFSNNNREQTTVSAISS